jgi:hypothetical protein
VIPEDDTAYAMLDQITEMTGSAACSVMSVSSCQARAPVFSQPQLLAVLTHRQLKRVRTALSFAHRVVRRRAQEPLLYMDKALAGTGGKQKTRLAGLTCRSSSCSMPCACGRLQIAGLCRETGLGSQRSKGWTRSARA